MGKQIKSAHKPAFCFITGKSYKEMYHFPLHASVITRNTLITIIKFARYHLLLACNSPFTSG